MENLEEFKNQINSLKVKKGEETFIKKEIISMINSYQLEYKENPEDMEDMMDPETIWNNICDECHDGAYLEEETNEPITELGLELFFKKYLTDIISENN